jgi:hypothetical protein
MKPREELKRKQMMQLPGLLRRLQERKLKKRQK